jgi:hypothetical protein
MLGDIDTRQAVAKFEDAISERHPENNPSAVEGRIEATEADLMSSRVTFPTGRFAPRSVYPERVAPISQLQRFGVRSHSIEDSFIILSADERSESTFR